MANHARLQNNFKINFIKILSLHSFVDYKSPDGFRSRDRDLYNVEYTCCGRKTLVTRKVISHVKNKHRTLCGKCSHELRRKKILDERGVNTKLDKALKDLDDEYEKKKQLIIQSLRSTGTNKSNFPDFIDFWMSKPWKTNSIVILDEL